MIHKFLHELVALTMLAGTFVAVVAPGGEAPETAAAPLVTYTKPALVTPALETAPTVNPESASVASEGNRV